jgi:purine-cytosine permease-like protein
MLHDQERELQLEILKIQVEQQHISTFFSMPFSAEISAAITMIVFYAGLYFYLDNPLFSLLASISGVSFACIIVLTHYLYGKQLGKFEKELERLRQRFSRDW